MKNRQTCSLMIFLALAFPLLLLQAQAAAAPPAKAEEPADASTDLIRLNYYPHSGKLAVSPLFSFSTTDTTTYTSPSGITTESDSTSYSQLNLNLQYGLPAGFRIGVSATELLHEGVTYTSFKNGSANSSTSATGSGLSDPTFQIAYRALPETSQGYSADVSLSIMPDWVENKSAEPNQDGTNGAGYGSVSLAVPIYWSSQWNELELSPGVGRNFKKTATSGVLYTDAPYWFSSLLIQDRIHLGDQWFVQPSLGLHSDTSYETTIGGKNYQKGNSFNAVPQLFVGYLASAQTLLDVELTYTSNSSTTLTDLTGYVSTAQNELLAIYLQAKFQF